MTILDITGRRQLTVDPRLIAEQDNCMKCMAEANKIGRVIGVPPGLHGLGRIQYGSIVWDDRVGRVRLYYCFYGSTRRCLIALAESTDGEHFDAAPLEPKMLDAPNRSMVHIRKKQPDCDRLLDAARAGAPVTMGGTLDSAEWMAAPASKNFVKSGSDEVAEFGTTVRCLYDDEAVYLGVNCPGKRPLAPRNGKVWEGREHLEIFIDPGCTRRRYLCLQLDRTAATQQAYHDDRGGSSSVASGFGRTDQGLDVDRLVRRIRTTIEPLDGQYLQA